MSEDKQASIEASVAAAFLTLQPAKFSGANLPPDILAGIGAVVAEWSYLAFQMTVILRIAHGLTKESQRALLVGAEVGVLCGHFRTLANTDFWIKDEKLREAIRKLAVDIQDASEARNSYAHGVFAYLGEQASPVRILMKKAEHRVTPGAESLTAETLTNHAKEAHALWERAQAITQKMKGRA